MADKQTPGKKPVDYGEVLVEALKRTPGNILGGGADVANLLLGLVTGKGLEGFVKTPAGGSEQINKAFGMGQGQNPVQQTAEAIMSMASPGGIAKAMILPAALLKSTKEIRDATKLVKQGKDAEAWKTYGVYVDPLDGEPKALLDPRKFNVPMKNIGLTESKNKPFVLTPQGIKVSDQFTGLMDEVVDYPELFNKVLSLNLLKLKSDVTPNQLGVFDQATNSVGLGYMTDPKELKSVLAHELQHGVQSDAQFVLGTNPSAFYADPAKKDIIDFFTAELLGKRNLLYQALPKLPAAERTTYNTIDKAIEDLLAPLQSARAGAFANYERTGGEAEARVVQQLLANPDLAKTTSPLQLQLDELAQTYGPNTTRFRGDEPDVYVDLWPETQAAVQKMQDPNVQGMLQQMTNYLANRAGVKP